MEHSVRTLTSPDIFYYCWRGEEIYLLKEVRESKSVFDGKSGSLNVVSDVLLAHRLLDNFFGAEGDISAGVEVSGLLLVDLSGPPCMHIPENILFFVLSNVDDIAEGGNHTDVDASKSWDQVPVWVGGVLE